MASLRTPATNGSAQGIVKVFKISSCVTGDTFSYSGPIKSWLVTNRTTTDAVTATFSSGTFTITVANTPDIDIWILI